MKICAECKHYVQGKQSCAWRPGGVIPMWLCHGFANDFNPWISPTNQADKCDVFEAVEEKQTEQK